MMKFGAEKWMRLLGSGLIAVCLSGTELRADETALFTSVAPDTLIVLDLSGSMDWNPAGGNSIWSNSSCSGPFYGESGQGYSTNCSRLAIAKRAIFDILDDNGNGTINAHDESSLNIRIGYMRFKDGDDTSGDYSDGNIKLIWPLGARYSRIYCNDATSCTGSSSSLGSVSGASANGGTPLASSLREAKLYFDSSKASDNAATCRQKFVILITDGADTYACNGNGTEGQVDQYKRRRESVAKAKALADAGYKVFVIGFGSAMPDYLEKTLNWMAFYGGTDNPNVSNSGSTAGYIPAAVASCQDSTTTGSCDGSHTNCYATSNDPGNTALSGYAFLAANADELSRALKATINIIREANYSFSQASVQSTRTVAENYLYEGSFQPINNDSFWRGHLKKFQISSDGTVGGMIWDAGEVLRARAASGDSGRNIYTILGSKTHEKFVVQDSTKDRLAAAVGVSVDALGSVVGFIRGETGSNDENWKLGDIFRSTPITIGAPSLFYYDVRDANNAFASFRQAHARSSANGKQLIVAGANDGQLHAFRTGTGEEAWSFIPPNLLPKLKNISHSSHPTLLSHQYFVDGPVTVADVWLGTDGRSKSPDDWKTLLISAEGRGATGYLWSASEYCETGMSGLYSAAAPYYCGYHALDVTEPPTPDLPFVYKWRLNAGSRAPYMGDPWSKMMIGRLKNGTDEKWVGFIGAGFNASDCSGGGTCDTRGKGFLVIDLADGNVLWSYTNGDNSNLAYSMPAPPAIVDTDNDGFIDTAYIGDLGGNVWRFKFCGAKDAGCTISNSTGTRLFESSSGVIRPIYTTITVARDTAGNLWTYWTTGDKSDPTSSSAQEKFFALKDNDRSSTFSVSDLENITTGTCNPASGKKGWYVNLTGGGEKILGDPTVFGGVVYFTTYIPPSGGNPCDQGGNAKLYALDFTCGGGMISGARSLDLGTGIASAPVISLKPGSGAPDLYVTLSGGSGADARTIKPANVTPPGVANRTNMLFWKDRRLQ